MSPPSCVFSTRYELFKKEWIDKWKVEAERDDRSGETSVHLCSPIHKSTFYVRKCVIL